MNEVIKLVSMFAFGAIMGAAAGYFKGCQGSSEDLRIMNEELEATEKALKHYRNAYFEATKNKTGEDAKEYVDKDVEATKKIVSEVLETKEPDIDDSAFIVITKDSYEHDHEGSESYNFDKVDLGYEIKTGQMYEAYLPDEIANASEPRLYYEIPGVRDVLSTLTIKDEDEYIYIRDLMSQVDYRIKIDREVK